VRTGGVLIPPTGMSGTEIIGDGVVRLGGYTSGCSGGCEVGQGRAACGDGGVAVEPRVSAKGMPSRRIPSSADMRSACPAPGYQCEPHTSRTETPTTTTSPAAILTCGRMPLPARFGGLPGPDAGSLGGVPGPSAGSFSGVPGPSAGSLEPAAGSAPWAGDASGIAPWAGDASGFVPWAGDASGFVPWAEMPLAARALPGHPRRCRSSPYFPTRLGSPGCNGCMSSAPSVGPKFPDHDTIRVRCDKQGFRGVFDTFTSRTSPGPARTSPGTVR
jgi:hypothetical protein